MRAFWVWVGGAALLLGGGCTKKNEIAADANTQLTADADPSLVCAPSTTTCEADTLTTCSADGSSTETSDCALGCFDAIRCNKIDPSNGLAPLLDMAFKGPDLELVGTTTIDTTSQVVTDDSGELTLPTSVLTDGPVEVFVIRVNSLVADKIIVTGSRALAIVSNGNVTLNLGLEVDADLHNTSPGGIEDVTTCGTRTSPVSSPHFPGAGGGGFGGLGGEGGDAVGSGGGPAGVANGNATLVPLRGGCNGGKPMENADTTFGGKGGGAVQIVSNTTILVPATGYISANGGGASGAPNNGENLNCPLNSPCYPGAGGGSGGAILLEAISVVVSSEAGLFANGGSGSCRVPGVNGTRSETRAVGADCFFFSRRGSGGDGGAGAGDDGLAGESVDGGGGETQGGGGGGGVGRIRINVPSGDASSVEGTISPAASFGALGTR